MSVTRLSFWSALNLLKELPSIIPAAMHLNFLTLRLYRFMLLPAEQASLFSSFLTVLLVNSSCCSWLQCGLVCIVLCNCCLTTFFVEPGWLLLSAVSNLFPSCSVPVRIDVGIWRSIVKEFRKASGEWFSNLLWSQLLDIKPALHWFECFVACAETYAYVGCDMEVVGVHVSAWRISVHRSQHDQSRS